MQARAAETPLSTNDRFGRSDGPSRGAGDQLKLAERRHTTKLFISAISGDIERGY